MALGLNIVVGYAGLLDLGYVAFWAIGGYCAGWFMSEFFYFLNIHFFGSVPAEAPGIHINFWMVLVIGGFVCALFGILIGAPTLRLKSDYLALVTLGFGEIIPQVFFNGEDFFGFNISNGTKGIVRVDPIPVGVKDLGPFDFGWKLLIFLLLTAVMVFISLRLRRGRLGRAWLAIREDELAASMMGVPLMRTKLASYAVGAFAGGLGGVAFATHVDGVYAERFNFTISIFLLKNIGHMGASLYNDIYVIAGGKSDEMRTNALRDQIQQYQGEINRIDLDLGRIRERSQDYISRERRSYHDDILFSREADELLKANKGVFEGMTQRQVVTELRKAGYKQETANALGMWVYRYANPMNVDVRASQREYSSGEKRYVVRRNFRLGGREM